MKNVLMTIAVMSCVVALGCEHDQIQEGHIYDVELEDPVVEPSGANFVDLDLGQPRQWTCLCRGGTFPHDLTYHGVFVCTEGDVQDEAVADFVKPECDEREMTIQPMDCVFVELDTVEECDAPFYME